MKLPVAPAGATVFAVSIVLSQLVPVQANPSALQPKARIEGKHSNLAGRPNVNKVSSSYTSGNILVPITQPRPTKDVTVRDSSQDLNSYVDRKLAALVFAGEKAMRIREVSATITRQILSGIADPKTTVFPSVAPNGNGGVSLFWKAAKRVIEVEVDPDLSYYVRARDAAGATVLEQEGRTAFPSSSVRGELAELSRDVSASNPKWRDVFAV